MGISMDGLCSGLARSYNSLVKTLHRNRNDDVIEVDIDDIQEDMDDIRESIGWLFCIYMDNIENFSNISDDLKNVLWFNSVKEEND